MTEHRAPQTPEAPDQPDIRFPSLGPKEAIPRSPVEPQTENSVAPSVQVTGTAITQSPELEWAFLLNEQRYLSEYIRFADQKAAFIFAFSLASLGLLFKQEIYAGLFFKPVVWLQSEVVGTIASILLLMSCTLSLGALLPRLWSSKKQGLVFWENLISYGSAEKYFEALRRSNPDSIHREVADHCFTLGQICNRKYTLIRYAIWAAPIGAILGMATIFVN